MSSIIHSIQSAASASAASASATQATRMTSPQDLKAAKRKASLGHAAKEFEAMLVKQLLQSAHMLGKEKAVTPTWRLARSPTE